MKLKSPIGTALRAAVGSNANNLRTLFWVRSCKQRWSERSCGRASVLSISAAVPARARSRSPSAPALPGKCWALTFQRRCWRALPSGCRRLTCCRFASCHNKSGNGVRTIIVESPDRFARDLTVQLTGHDFLKNLGISLIPATAPDFVTEDTPTAVLVRQVLGAIVRRPSPEKARNVFQTRRF